MIRQTDFQSGQRLFARNESAATFPGALTGGYATRRQRLAVWQLLQEWGNTSTSYMTLNPANRWFCEEQGQAFLAYRQRWGVAVSLGDPVGSPDACRRCISQFLEFCFQNHLIPVFFAIEKNHAAYAEAGLCHQQIAEDAYLDLQKLAFNGKSWQDVRTALNRAKREKLTLHEFKPGQCISADLLFQIQQVSADWQRRKKLPKLGFTLGDLPVIQDPAVRTFYAQDEAGKVQGFVSWLPMYGAQGWALDLMRRRESAMQGLMEFLIASSALRFQAEGCAYLGLGAAPLAPVQADRKLSHLEYLANRAVPFFGNFYCFQSLFTFKRKFQPNWKPLYMFYPAQRNLPRIIFSLLSLYLLPTL